MGLGPGLIGAEARLLFHMPFERLRAQALSIGITNFSMMADVENPAKGVSII